MFITNKLESEDIGFLTWIERDFCGRELEEDIDFTKFQPIDGAPYAIDGAPYETSTSAV